VRTNLLFTLAALFITLAQPMRSSSNSQDTGFLDRSVSLHGATYKYQVYLPDNWSTKQSWPIILFLHGYGERGSDGLFQTDLGLPHAIRLNRSRFPVVVVIVQCPMDHWWTQPNMEELALAELTVASKEFHGDPKRTYLTGLSMGGFGAWDLAAKYPGKFAAVVPICGGIVFPEILKSTFPDVAKESYPDEPRSYELFAKKIGRTPVWIFHGAEDEQIPVENSRKLCDALKAPAPTSVTPSIPALPMHPGTKPMQNPNSCRGYFPNLSHDPHLWVRRSV
jgi:predicted peptidase